MEMARHSFVHSENRDEIFRDVHRLDGAKAQALNERAAKAAKGGDKDSLRKQALFERVKVQLDAVKPVRALTMTDCWGERLEWTPSSGTWLSSVSMAGPGRIAAGPTVRPSTTATATAATPASSHEARSRTGRAGTAVVDTVTAASARSARS